jgi:hypothetical protein
MPDGAEQGHMSDRVARKQRLGTVLESDFQPLTVRLQVTQVHGDPIFATEIASAEGGESFILRKPIRFSGIEPIALHRSPQREPIAEPMGELTIPNAFFRTEPMRYLMDPPRMLVAVL